MCPDAAAHNHNSHATFQQTQICKCNLSNYLLFIVSLSPWCVCVFLTFVLLGISKMMRYFLSRMENMFAYCMKADYRLNLLVELIELKRQKQKEMKNGMKESKMNFHRMHRAQWQSFCNAIRKCLPVTGARKAVQFTSISTMSMREWY